MLIRQITTSDLSDIINIHLNSFDEKHFSKTFSPKLLREYLGLLIEYNQFTYAAITDEKISGYIIAGTQSIKALNNFKKKYYFSIIFQLIKHPSFLFEKIRDFISSASANDNVKPKPKVRLYLIAVDNNKKGIGIGKRLIHYLEMKFIEQNIDIYGLSVRKENERGIKFYESLGYVKSGTDHKSIYFIKKIKVTL